MNCSSPAQQELRSKREQELATLKKSLEDESANHEAQLTDVRHKHSQEISIINEQLESLRKTKAVLDKQRQTLEAENADLAVELKNSNQSRQENDRRRKQAESQIAELQVRDLVPTMTLDYTFTHSFCCFLFCFHAAFFIFACCEKGRRGEVPPLNPLKMFSP